MTSSSCRCRKHPPSALRPSLRRVTHGAMLAALLAMLAAPSLAATSCSFKSSAPVDFGAYDVFSASANLDGVGSIAIKCHGGGGPTFSVSLGSGMWSSGYASRRMRHDGDNFLNYNLYTDVRRTLVWGDGTGGSRTRTAAANSDTTLSIYGGIPAGQDVAAGIYLDNITVTVAF